MSEGMPQARSAWTEQAVSAIRNEFAAELDLRSADSTSIDQIPADSGARLRHGDKIPKTRAARELLIKICQDHRLMPDDIDSVIAEFLASED